MSNQYDKILEFIGNFKTYDDIVINYPDKENPFKFEAFYFNKGRLIGFSCMDSPNSANVIYEAMKNNILITSDLIRNYGLNVERINKQIEGLEIYNKFIENENS